MEAIRISACLRSAPPFECFSDENMLLESGVVSAFQGGLADGFGMRQSVGGLFGQEPLASRDLRAGNSR